MFNYKIILMNYKNLIYKKTLDKFCGFELTLLLD